MQRNFRNYLLNIEFFKTRYTFFITAGAFLIYLILVMIASKGPQLYDSHFIEQYGGQTYCNENLDITKPGEIVNWANIQPYYQCLSCYELYHSSSQKISFTATQQFSNTAAPMNPIKANLTELTSPFLFSDIYTCKDLMRFTNQQNFPLIDFNNHQNLKEVVETEGWQVQKNNQEDLIEWNCRQNSTDDKSIECTTNQFINQRVKNQQVFAYFMKFSMNYSISDNNYPIHFQVQEENPSYYSYTFYFKVFFLSLSIYMLIYLTKKLKPIKFMYWLPIHKWLYILLTVLILFNDPFGIFNILIPNIFFDIISDLSEVLFNIILLYFWLVIFETAIKQSGDNKCIFEKFKLVLIILFTFIALYLKIYALVYRPQHQLFKELEPTGTLSTLKTILIIFSLLYLLYLFILSVTFYKLTSFKSNRSQLKDKLAVYNFACVISNIIAVVIIIQWIHNFRKPDYVSVQSYVIPYSIINIYLYLLAILYSPAEGQNLTEVKQSENYDIIKNIYGDAVQLQESDTHNSDEKAEGTNQKVYAKN